MDKTSMIKPNRLALEKSPYLLQHKLNPVDWYPWGPEAFSSATKENKPIFLSIGYSTCHWCHVMAHESFEDPVVASLMNEVFVSIKVDREEHPDIDSLYMRVCQMMTGTGGWPLSIIMTSGKQPFYAGTYIPRETRFGRIGMLQLIPAIKEMWTNRQLEIVATVDSINSMLVQLNMIEPSSQDLSEPVLSQAYHELRSEFDPLNGGFGKYPKFPTPHQLLFLLRYWKRTAESAALEMVEKTLQAMRFGGIYDHVGFGFHRYSTDQLWRVPHFEKMLYDQALLAIAYLETFQATKKQEYAQTSREIFTYVLRDMTSPEGGFYCAEDADSEGREGKFYLWSIEELRRILEGDELSLCLKLFNITESGNYSGEITGEKSKNNILYMSRPFEDISRELSIPLKSLEDNINRIKAKLFSLRESRVHPSKDDKILTDWNGLMVAALAKGGRVLNDVKYCAAAEKAVNFIMNKMINKEGSLLHRYREGEAAFPALLDDYAFLILGLLDLYETTFDTRHLKNALNLNSILLKHFWDEKNGGFFFSGDDAELIGVRQKEIYDGAIPSGNSVAMLNLLRLARLTASPELEKKAAMIGRAFSNVVRSPSHHTQLLVAVDFAVGPSYEVVIAGDSRSKDTAQMLSAINQEFLPNKVLVLVPQDTESAEIKKIARYTRDLESVNNKATAYVCLNYSCRLPTTDISTMMKLLLPV